MCFISFKTRHPETLIHIYSFCFQKKKTTSQRASITLFFFNINTKTHEESGKLHRIQHLLLRAAKMKKKVTFYTRSGQLCCLSHGCFGMLTSHYPRGGGGGEGYKQSPRGLRGPPAQRTPQSGGSERRERKNNINPAWPERRQRAAVLFKRLVGAPPLRAAGVGALLKLRRTVNCT